MNIIKILVREVSEKRDSLGSAFAKLLSVAAQYSILSLLAKNLLDQEFAVWNLLLHLSTFISILDFGMGGGGLRNALIQSHEQQGHPGRGEALFCSSFFLTFLLCLISLGVLIGATPQIIKKLFYIEGKLAMAHLPLVLIGFFTLTLFKMPFGLYASGCHAYQEGFLKALWDSCESLLLILLISTVAYFQGTLFQGTFFHFFCVYYVGMAFSSVWGFFLFLRRRKWSWKMSSLKPAYSLVKTHLIFWLQNLFSLALFSLTPLLINFLDNIIVASEYLLIYRLECFILGVHFALLNPLWSKYTRMFYRKEFLQIEQSYRASLKLSSIGLIFGAVMIVIFYQPLIRLWTGHELTCTPLVMLSGLWMVLYGMINCLSTLLNALGKIRFQVISLCLGAILNMTLGLLLGKAFDIIGVVVAAIIALLPLLFSNIIEIYSLRTKGSFYETR